MGGLLPLALLLIAAGLRFYRIDYQSYWNDEGNSRVLASRAVPTLLRNAAADIHPPGYYLLLKGWRALLGESEFALRSFSVFAGVVLIAVLFRLGADRFGTRVGLAAALLGAINPFLIYYSQEARMYALLAMAGAGSFWLFGKMAAGGWRLAAGYVLVTTLGLYTHYAFGFIVLAQLAALLASLAQMYVTSRYARHPLTTGHALSVALPLLPLLTSLFLFIPWAPIAYRQLTGWPAAREFHPFWESLLDLTRYLAFGRTIQTAEALPGLVAVGLLLLMALWRSGQWSVVSGQLSAASGWRLAASGWFWLWLLIPIGLTLVFGLLTEAFSKFLLVAVPPLCVLLGLSLQPMIHNEYAVSQPGASGQPLAASLRTIRLACFAVLVYVTAVSLNHLYFNPTGNATYFRDDYRGIAQYIARLKRPGDAIITIAPNQVEVFTYYHPETPGNAPIFPLPDTRPLDPVRTQAQLETIASQHTRLFVLYWGDQQADPQKFVEGWLNAHTFKAAEQWFGQVRLATYAAARPATEIGTPVAARFGDHILLEGYTLQSQTLLPGDILQLTLFWRAEAALSERYKVFLHLYADVNAPPLAQQDAEPGGGLVLTTIWQPGQQVIDNHGLLIPPDLAPGDYRLMVGLYRLDDGTRLPVQVGDTIVGDRLDLGSITIRDG